MTTSLCPTLSSLDTLTSPLRPLRRLRRRASVAPLLLVALASSTSLAQEAPASPARNAATPDAAAREATPPDSTEPPADTTPAPATPATTLAAETSVTATSTPTPVVAASTTSTTSEPSPALRRALEQSACSEGLTRFTDSALGLATAGALFGVGFAAEGQDMTWSHTLWVASGVTGVASVLALLVPTDLEVLARDSANQSDAELRAEWKKIAEAALVERRTGAVVGSLVGAAAVVGGAVVLDGEGDFSQDNRTILGTSLVTGGALSIANGLVHWFVPSAVERDYALVEATSDVQLSFSAAPTPGGAAFSVTGVF